jgi:apolipoprotein N-acyltransferase
MMTLGERGQSVPLQGGRAFSVLFPDRGLLASAKAALTAVSLVCTSAVLLVLSFPKFDLGGLAWVGLVPLLIALEGKTPKQAFLLSSITGIGFVTVTSHWLWTVPAYNLLDYLLLQVLFYPLFWSLWGLGLVWIRGRTRLSAALVAPPLWVALEYLRSHLSFLSLPWMLLGHSQYQHPSLIQITSLTGVYGLSFLIVLVNVAIAEAFLHGRRLTESSPLSDRRPFPVFSVTAAAGLLIGTALFGAAVMSRGMDGDRVTVALAQGNVPQNQKWDRSFKQTILDRHAALTREAAHQQPALIIWPESAVPGDVEHDPALQRSLAQVAAEAKAYLFVGSSEYGKFTSQELANNRYNSMVLFSPTGKIEGHYRKMTLVPFGEYKPLDGVVEWPQALVAGVGRDLPGEDYTLLTVGRATFGTAICWEVIFPDHFREFVKRGAEFMVSATNEGWFGDTAAPYQLLAMTVFRAAENRVAIARSANIGLSAFIDPFGRITERLTGSNGKELFAQGTLMGTIMLSDSRTFYTRHGDVFAFLMIFACGVILIHALMKGSGYATPRVDHMSSRS